MTKVRAVRNFKEENSLIKSPWLKNKLINCGVYIVFLFLLLLINYLAALEFKGNIWILLDILLMVFSVSPIFFFKTTLFDMIYLSILMVFVTVLIAVNINYYKFFGTFFALKDLKWAMGNVSQAGDNVRGWNWGMTITDILLCCLAVAGLLVFNIKFNFKETKTLKNPTRKTISILAGIVMGSSLLTYEFTMGMWTISQKNRGVESIKYVDYSTKYHFKDLGMISFYNREIRQFMTDRGESDNGIIKYLNDARLVADNYTGLLSPANTNQSYPNVFVILLEMGDRLMINEATTPNLYKLTKGNGANYGGVYGAHNYSFNHTNVSNTISITGSYPLRFLDQHDKYTVPFSLPNILKSKGYSTRFYYDIVESEDGYHDLPFIPTLGFDNCFWHNDLLPGVEPWAYKKSNYILDSVVEEKIKDNLTNYVSSSDKPFYSQWMTMLMHNDNGYTDGNRQLIADLHTKYDAQLNEAKDAGKWSNPYTNEEVKTKYEIYTLKTMDFDKAVGDLMNFFYESGNEKLKNTLFICFGDHMFYENGGNKSMAKWIKNIDDDDNLNLYSTVLGMYHPNLTNKIKNDTTGLFNGFDLQKTTSPACIVPTVLDLLGIPYNPNLYQDSSIFNLYGSDKYNKDNDEIYYSGWRSIYMSENYTSGNGGSITNVIKDDGKQDVFKKKLRAKQHQLRIIDSIYHKGFFERYKYEDFIPKADFINNFNKEVALVKYYE